MEEKYEIQVEYLQGNSSIWMSMVDQENKKIYVYDSEENAKMNIEKIQLEMGQKTCRIVKIN